MVSLSGNRFFMVRFSVHYCTSKMKIAMDKQTFENQLKRTFEAFKEKPKTMLQVSNETGIMRASICRYVAHLKKRKKIVTVKKGTCPLSKHKAQFLSTDEQYFPKETQPELFPSEGCAV